MGSEQISKFVDQLEKESNNIRKQCLQQAWAMRGGIQYNDVMNLCDAERKLITEISNDNLETTQKSGLPFF